VQRRNCRPKRRVRNRAAIEQRDDRSLVARVPELGQLECPASRTIGLPFERAGRDEHFHELQRAALRCNVQR
jgi:hypothetical protein